MAPRVGVSAIVLAVVMSLTGSKPIIATAEAEKALPTVEQAIAWRQGDGLRSDLAYVQRSLTDRVAFPNTDWAVPLSQQEVAELARRARLQAATTPVVEYASTLETFAGAYSENARGGVLVVLFAGGAPTLAELARHAPAEAQIEIRTVVRSLADLMQLKARIAAATDGLAADGLVINGVGIDTIRNTVDVGLQTVSPATKAVLHARFGPALVFHQQSPAEADCTSDMNCWPPKGGINIAVVADNVKQCTSGYIVKRVDSPTVRQILTAGHCNYVAGGVNTWWEHGPGGPNIGKSQTNTWVGTGVHLSDVGLIGIEPGSLPSTKNQFYCGNSGGPVICSATSYFLHSSQLPGHYICRYGFKTDRECGHIKTPVDVRNKSCVGDNDTICKWIERTWVMDFDSDRGDSGGPVFLHDDPPSAPHIAYGTHVHSTLGYVPTNPGWYSPYNIGRDEWQSITGIQFNICTTAAC